MVFPNVSPQQFVQRMVQMNPQMLNNPQYKHYYDVIMSGDQNAANQLAQNLCNSYGVTPQQGMQQFQQFLSSNFRR